MKNIFFRTICAAAVLAAASQASASTLVTVFTVDQIYGSFFGTISSGTTGQAAQLQWRSAGYGWSGNIGLTDTAGTILFNLKTNGDDVYRLFAPGSGNAVIGANCDSSNASACVVLPSNVFTSLLSTISSLNGGNGICCGGSDIFIQAASSAPEPDSWVLMIAGFGLVGTALRRRTRVFA